MLDASYSDGLSVVSLFLQRGAAVRGAARLASRRAFAACRCTRPGQETWTSRVWRGRQEGYVYTVIADAPPQAITRVIAALPHERDAGFLDRVARGIRRIGSWFDPFG